VVNSARNNCREGMSVEILGGELRRNFVYTTGENGSSLNSLNPDPGGFFWDQNWI